MILDAAAAPPVVAATVGASRAWTPPMEIPVGIVPLPVFLLPTTPISGFAFRDRISGEITVLVVGPSTFSALGERIPILRSTGRSPPVTVFLPSFPVAHQLLKAAIVRSVTTCTKQPTFIFLFVTAVVVGAIPSEPSRTGRRGRGDDPRRRGTDGAVAVRRGRAPERTGDHRHRGIVAMAHHKSL